MLPVSLPRFTAVGNNGAPPSSAPPTGDSGDTGTHAPASATAAPPQQQHLGGLSAAAWVSGEGQGDFDFDLLAEYLLDDGTSSWPASHGIPPMDFNIDSAPPSGVVSPEQSDDGMPSISESIPPPTPTVPVPAPAPQQPALSAPQQVEHVVQHQHPQPAQYHQVPQPPVTQAPAPVPQPLQPHPQAQPVVTTHVVSPQATSMVHPTMQIAPSHGQFAALPANVARTGVPVPVTVAAPMPASMPVPAPVPVPAPAAPGVAPPVVVHHHGAGMMLPNAPHNKRRRVDAPLVAVANGPPGAVLASHLVAHAAMPGRGRQKTQAQIDRRRERNRILARRTRLRKKFFFESLQKEVMDLQRENAILKEVARKSLKPEVSKELLADCKAMERLPSAVQEACGEAMGDLEQQDFNLVRSIQSSQQCFIITDPSLQDNPIVYASDAFHTLTGYKREEVLGRNCRFLQGTETSPEKIEQIRKAVAAGQDATVTLINYTANGTAFWNKLFIAALRDAQNNIVNFIGVIVKVASPGPEDPEVNKCLPGAQPQRQAPSSEDEVEEREDNPTQTKETAVQPVQQQQVQAQVGTEGPVKAPEVTVAPEQPTAVVDADVAAGQGASSPPVSSTAVPLAPVPAPPAVALATATAPAAPVMKTDNN